MFSEITKRNLALLTDFYELLMMEGYFSLSKKEKRNETLVTFDVFYRNNPFRNGFAVFCGLNEIIDYLETLKFNDDDIEYLRKYNTFDEEFFFFF